MSAESKKSRKVQRSKGEAKSKPAQTLNCLQLTNEAHALRNGQQALKHAVENNARVFSDAFQFADAQLHVLQRTMNDLVLQRIRTTPEGGIDYPAYFGEYWACIALTDLLSRSVGEQPAGSLIVAPSEEDLTIEFGGS